MHLQMLRRFISFLLLLIFIFSCTPSRKIIKHSSVFVEINELGINKEEFIEKFGEPLNKDISKENGKLIEALYYVEILKGIPVTTKFIFVNDTLVEQSNVSLDFKYREIKRLEDEIRRNSD